MPESYGLIGRSLAHSFSPSFFQKKFETEGTDASYELIELAEESDLADFDFSSYTGLNVTVPYKQAVIPYLDALDEEAQAIGAVNCISIEDGKTMGHNTDHYGFRESLRPILKRQHRKALILGNGGAAKAIRYALDEIGLDHLTVSREPGHGQVGYGELNAAAMEQFLFIINTTPLGTYPDIENRPAIPYEFLGPEHLLYDLVYNPEETAFLKAGREMGTMCMNGYRMLVLQAERSWAIWNR